MARHLAKRIERVAVGVERWGQGDFAHRVPVEGRDEVATLAATFNQAAGQIDALMGQQKQMLANASHELRSPLARLRMALELVGEEAAPEARARLIEDARKDIVELDTLIEELLLMSRADARTPRRPLETVELRRLVVSEAERLGGGAQVSGAEVSLRGDPLLLRHMVRNLLENAYRHGQGKDVRAVLASTDESRDPGGRGRRPGHSRVGAREDLRAVLSAERAGGRLGRGDDRVRHRARAGAPGCALPRRRGTGAGAGLGRRQPVRGRAAAARTGCGGLANLLQRVTLSRCGEGRGEGRPCERQRAARHSLAILSVCGSVSHPRVAIVGAGFGGLSAARSLAGAEVEVTIVDRLNHHLFQPLLYQVATAGLSADEIAVADPRVLRRQPNVDGAAGRGRPTSIVAGAASCVLADGARAGLRLPDRRGRRDAPATSATTSGRPSRRASRSIDDALEIRRRVLLAFEAAERDDRPDERAARC